MLGRFEEFRAISAVLADPAGRLARNADPPVAAGSDVERSLTRARRSASGNGLIKRGPECSRVAGGNSGCSGNAAADGAAASAAALAPGDLAPRTNFLVLAHAYAATRPDVVGTPTD